MNADKGDSCPLTSDESHTVISDVVTNFIDTNVPRLSHHTETKYFSEEDRLITFRTWNGSQNVIQKLVKAGFYYVDTEFKVKCPYCSFERKIWTIADDPDSAHREGSPKCIYILWAKPASDYYNLTNGKYHVCAHQTHRLI